MRRGTWEGSTQCRSRLLPEPFSENLWHQDKDDVGVGGNSITNLLSTPGAITAILNLLIQNILNETGDTTLHDTILDATFPVGTYKWQAHSTPDYGFLAADGGAHSRTTYARLFAKLGTTYGAGDGSTTFNVPNVKGRVLVHRDTGDVYWDALGEARGANTTALGITHLAAHDHNFVGIGTAFSLAGSAHNHGSTGLQDTNHTHQISTQFTNNLSHHHAAGVTLPAEGPSGGGVGLTLNTAGISANHAHSTSNESGHTHQLNGHDHGFGSQGSGTAFDIVQKSIVGFCTIRY